MDFAAFNFKVQLKYHILMHFNFAVWPRYYNLQLFDLAIVLQSDFVYVYEFPTFYKYRGNHEIWTQDLNTSLFVFLYFLCVCVCMCVFVCVCLCAWVRVHVCVYVCWPWRLHLLKLESVGMLECPTILCWKRFFPMPSPFIASNEPL